MIGPLNVIIRYAGKLNVTAEVKFHVIGLCEHRWDGHRYFSSEFADNLLGNRCFNASREPGASIWKLSLVSDVTKSLSARNERLTNV